MITFPFNPEANVKITKPAGEVSLSFPEAELSFSFPVGVSVKQNSPLADVTFPLIPEGNFIIKAAPSAILHHTLPIGEIKQVFYTPVLALDDGYSFLWLDDGARLSLAYDSVNNFPGLLDEGGNPLIDESGGYLIF